MNGDLKMSGAAAASPHAAAPEHQPRAAEGSAGPLYITAHGTPAAQGSKRHVGNGRMVESSKALQPWRDTVTAAAIAAMQEAGHAGFGRLAPVRVSADFFFARPKAHYRTGRHADKLRADAPLSAARKPDIDKLCRAVLDALVAARVMHDDSQVVVLDSAKRYADGDQRPGAQIFVLDMRLGAGQ